MFTKTAMPILREGSQEAAETIIAASVKVEGDFSSQGSVLIEGTVEGKLHTAKDLRVGERAKISADVSATNAVVAGEIRGNLSVTEKLELEPTARIVGDVRTKILLVSAGATINGRIVMGAEAEAAAKKVAEPRPVEPPRQPEPPKPNMFNAQPPQQH
jgi:cytoskeletal protein CcmA (bactofilin family)